MLFHVIWRGKRIISQIDIILESQRELSMSKQFLGRLVVIKPMVDRLEGVEAAIVLE